jgi:hypothetical protein
MRPRRSRKRLCAAGATNGAQISASSSSVRYGFGVMGASPPRLLGVQEFAQGNPCGFVLGRNGGGKACERTWRTSSSRCALHQAPEGHVESARAHGRSLGRSAEAASRRLRTLTGESRWPLRWHRVAGQRSRNCEQCSPPRSDRGFANRREQRAGSAHEASLLVGLGRADVETRSPLKAA